MGCVRPRDAVPLRSTAGPVVGVPPLRTDAARYVGPQDFLQLQLNVQGQAGTFVNH